MQCISKYKTTSSREDRHHLHDAGCRSGDRPGEFCGSHCCSDGSICRWDRQRLFLNEWPWGCLYVNLFIVLPGQHDCVTVINNFFSRARLEYYTRPQGLEREPKLPPWLAGPLHKIIMTTNLNPVKVRPVTEFKFSSSWSRIHWNVCGGRRNDQTTDPNRL